LTLCVILIIMYISVCSTYKVKKQLLRKKNLIFANNRVNVISAVGERVFNSGLLLFIILIN